jgi:hypothetical protein
MLKALEVDARVLTGPSKDSHLPLDWAPDARRHVTWGVVGTVIKVSNGHGLCYEVYHDDGSETTAWYNPEELVRTTKVEKEQVEAKSLSRFERF